MGLISTQDRRPRDWGYKVAFDRKDLPSLQEMARHIRETHDTDMIESFNARCEQKLKTGSAELDNDIEIQQVTKTKDLVVNVGLQQSINIILGTSPNRWVNFGIAQNSGTNPPLVTNTTLDGSVAGPWYLALDIYGWSEARGMKLFFGTISTQEVGGYINTNTVNEIGIGTGIPVTLLNREMFFNNPVTRTIAADGHMYKQVFMFSCVIEFCPVA